MISVERMLANSVSASSPTSFVEPHHAVRENLEAFGKAVRGQAPYAVDSNQKRYTVACLEAIMKAVTSGRVEPIEV